MRRHRPLAAALLIGACAVIGGALLVTGGARANQNVAAIRYEYGELTVVGNDAVFWVRDKSVYLEGPQANAPVRTVGRRGLNIIQPPHVIHLNTLGLEGWEVVGSGVNAAGETFLLKRPI